MKCLIPILCFIISPAVKGQNVLSAARTPESRGRKTFIPASFSNKFSLNTPPVLTIHPGDTISTETIDAAGFDKNAVKRQKGGNPLTGPFYIEGAFPGDVLAVTLFKVQLNRSKGFTSESF